MSSTSCCYSLKQNYIVWRKLQG